MALVGLPWRAAAADLPEEDYLLPEPLTSALNVALAKARAIATEPHELVLAADTLVVDAGEPLGKPADALAAAAMLERLRGRAHAVLTGVVLRQADGRAWGGVVESRVHMRGYTHAELRAYVARGEPFDKAGGYAIQDVTFRPVERVEGCYLNVVGLPVCAVAAGLEGLGIGVSRPASVRSPCEYCARGAALVSIG